MMRMFGMRCVQHRYVLLHCLFWVKLSAGSVYAMRAPASNAHCTQRTRISRAEGRRICHKLWWSCCCSIFGIYVTETFFHTKEQWSEGRKMCSGNPWRKHRERKVKEYRVPNHVTDGFFSRFVRIEHRTGWEQNKKQKQKNSRRRKRRRIMRFMALQSIWHKNGLLFNVLSLSLHRRSSRHSLRSLAVLMRSIIDRSITKWNKSGC